MTAPNDQTNPVLLGNASAHMKVYRVERLQDGRVFCAVFGEATKYALYHVVYHSPTGFETGYAGSGPADLALSILTDHLGASPVEVCAFLRGNRLGVVSPKVQTAAGLHQMFKEHFVMNSSLKPGEDYRILSTEIDEWLTHIAPGEERREREAKQ